MRYRGKYYNSVQYDKEYKDAYFLTDYISGYVDEDGVRHKPVLEFSSLIGLKVITINPSEYNNIFTGYTKFRNSEVTQLDDRIIGNKCVQVHATYSRGIVLAKVKKIHITYSDIVIEYYSLPTVRGHYIRYYLPSYFRRLDKSIFIDSDDLSLY